MEACSPAMDVSMGRLLHHIAGAGVTLEMKVQYMAPVRNGLVRCEASVLRRGRKLAFIQFHALANGKLVAHATGTWILSEAA